MIKYLKLNIVPGFYIWKQNIEKKVKRRGYSYYLPCKTVKAFTLAEVLITLTIIGVVAALTIPAVIQNTQNAELRTAARKALSIASQAYALAVIDNGGGFGACNFFSGPTTMSYTKFNALKSKLSMVKDCPYNTGAYSNCWASSGVGSANSPTNCAQWGINNQTKNSAFVTADGMYWMLYSYSGTLGQDWVAVDVNGAKGPNDWGKDIFVLTMNDTAIQPVFTAGCYGSLTHNDGSIVQSSEFTNPFKQ